MKTLSVQRPRPSMLIRTSASRSTPLKPVLVNWLTRSVLKIASLRFLQSLDAQRRGHRVRQPPSENLAARPVHYWGQIEQVPPHRQGGDVGTPDLVRPRDLQIAQQVQVSTVLRMRIPRQWALADGRHLFTISRHTCRRPAL